MYDANKSCDIALYHLGVLKALNEQGLLPRIISGHAVGAMIAALICIHTDEELPVSRHPMRCIGYSP